MNIIVISDKDNAERRENVCKEFGKHNLEFSFFDAIMANKMLKEELATKALKDTFLTPSEIGCALSHIGVYKKFFESNQKSIMICEDDIFITEYFDKTVIEKIREFVEFSDEPRLVVLQKSIYHHKRVQNIAENMNIYSARNLFCTHGYIINRAAAHNIMSIQNPVRFEIDAFKFYYWLNICKLYCLDKNLILQQDEEVMASTVDSGTSSDSSGESQRTSKKNSAYKELYRQLSLKGKIISQYRRFEKACYKMFEGLDY